MDLSHKWSSLSTWIFQTSPGDHASNSAFHSITMRIMTFTSLNPISQRQNDRNTHRHMNPRIQLHSHTHNNPTHRHIGHLRAHIDHTDAHLYPTHPYVGQPHPHNDHTHILKPSHRTSTSSRGHMFIAITHLHQDDTSSFRLHIFTPMTHLHLDDTHIQLDPTP